MCILFVTACGNTVKENNTPPEETAESCPIEESTAFDILTPEAGTVIVDSLLTDSVVKNSFYIEMIDDALFERINGYSFKAATPVGRDSLRRLNILHKDSTGTTHLGELICHSAIARELMEIFRELYDADYPIESVRLIEDFYGDDTQSMQANNTSCFNTRHRTGQTAPSLHAYGLAVDINPRYNPLVKQREGRSIVEPEDGREFVDRTLEHPYMIKQGDLAHELFVRYGFRWGGRWTHSKDYQHFEKPLESIEKY